MSNSVKLSHASGATQNGRVMVERSDRMWSTGEGNGKPLNITVIQAYAPTSNAQKAEFEWFYEDQQNLLELTPKNMSFSL